MSNEAIKRIDAMIEEILNPEVLIFDSGAYTLDELCQAVGISL